MGKPIYEPPVLVRHQSGLMNKFGAARSLRVKSDIDGVPVDQLVEQYGSPVFVFSKRTIIERFREMKDAFTLRWPRFRMAWSYKTNYLDAVCRLFHREGAYAEVVSEFELDKALHLGVPPDRIHFNGPLKTEAVLERCLPAGTMIHIDHFDELALAERVATRLGIRPRVAIRINLMTAATQHWARFGFNLESGQAMAAVVRLLAGGQLELAGIHCHLGTFIHDTDAYRDAAEKLAGFTNDVRRAHGVQLSFIDLGGGFPSHNTLKAQYLPGEEATPSFARYAEAIVSGLRLIDAPAEQMPTLVLESGRALIDDAGSLVATVIANKRLPNGVRGLVIDAGVNILFTSFWYRHDIHPAQRVQGMVEPTIVFGPLCMNIDVVRETSMLPPLKVGDRVVIGNVGAYNVTQWMQFITYRPGIVLIGDDRKHGLIRRPETLESVISHEVTPSWL